VPRPDSPIINDKATNPSMPDALPSTVDSDLQLQAETAQLWAAWLRRAAQLRAETAQRQAETAQLQAETAQRQDNIRNYRLETVNILLEVANIQRLVDAAAAAAAVTPERAESADSSEQQLAAEATSPE
jgi:hypothetical protein